MFSDLFPALLPDVSELEPLVPLGASRLWSRALGVHVWWSVFNLTWGSSFRAIHHFSEKQAHTWGGSAHVGGGLLTAPTAVRDEGLPEQEMTWPSRWETTTPAASNILGHYTRLRRAKQQIIANPGSENGAGSILNEKPALHMAGLDVDSLGWYIRPCWGTTLNAPRERVGLPLLRFSLFDFSYGLLGK